MRKFTHKKIINIAMTREQIRMVEDEWYSRLNNYKRNTITYG